ncbi:hypothetical protein GCM10022217_13400 [Chryseobacterium ginsenosidimutans]|uniref:hypothetical protein n=1 Tax=Chryseobacterium ginsenosidimutans TaxID=687846 RepID=UPI0031CF4F04
MKFYYYIFYHFYKLWDYISSPKTLSDFKAVISIAFLESTFLLSYLYYTLTVLSKVSLVIITLVVFIFPNLYLFIFNEKWKIYFQEFQEYPKAKTQKYSLIIWFITIIIIVNFIFSLNYFLSH